MPVTFLPTIANESPPAPQAEPDKARQVYELMKAHPEQRRTALLWNDKLAFIALDKCRAQAHGNWTGHVDPDGHGPNWWTRQLGYSLPDSYGKGDADNWIESLLHGGQGNVESVWQTWMDSPGHRDHILGTGKYGDIYSAQICVGIAHYYLDSSRFNHYFAIISAPEPT